MVDYTYTENPAKNFFCIELVDDGYISFINKGGLWSSAGGVWCYCPITFLQYVDVCENDVTGIHELDPGSVSLFPNPANDVVNIVSANDIRTIEVLNYIGQTVYKTDDVNLKVTKLDVTGFTAGEYFVKITTMNGIKTLKFNIIH